MMIKLIAPNLERLAGYALKDGEVYDLEVLQYLIATKKIDGAYRIDKNKVISYNLEDLKIAFEHEIEVRPSFPEVDM